MNEPILHNLTIPPRANNSETYRWCDYIELRCLTHRDKRFSRDAFAEAIEENQDTGTAADETDLLEIDEVAEADNSESDIDPISDREETRSAFCFRHLRWRQKAFSDAWPFQLDEHAQEVQLKPALTPSQTLYLSLLLSASLKYCPLKRWRDLTGRFERVSISIFRKLMPTNSSVHAFGAAEGERYRGHLFDRLTQLAEDVRGHLLWKKEHFAKRDAGDGGLDIVAWHDLGDQRVGIPIAFAQCGCTAEGWPNKMLEASPARLGSGLVTPQHDWATYYFMPLDLSTEVDGKMDWQMLSDFGRAIVIDRLRFIRLADAHELADNDLIGADSVTEARGMALT